jgi:hypothetical protein
MATGSIFPRARWGVILVASAATAVGIPGGAEAATIKGTVVAKDAKRGTIAAATRSGAIRTLRTSSASRVRVGKRLTANVTRRGDGTYTVKNVKWGRGAAKRARVRGTVVQRSAKRYLISAGGSTFAVAKRRSAKASASAVRTAQAGDVVIADVELGDDGASCDDVKPVGQADKIEIEGIFLDFKDGVMRLGVERKGLVEIKVPEGMQVSAQPGDEVELIASIAEDGTFTLVALHSDDENDDHGDDDDDHGFEFDSEDGELDIEGVITQLSATSITVSAGPDAVVVCTVPAGTDLTGFAVNDAVEMECAALEDGTFELRKLESDTREVEVGEDDDHSDHGDDKSGDDDKKSDDGDTSGKDD